MCRDASHAGPGFYRARVSFSAHWTNLLSLDWKSTSPKVLVRDYADCSTSCLETMTADRTKECNVVPGHIDSCDIAVGANVSRTSLIENKRYSVSRMSALSLYVMS